MRGTSHEQELREQWQAAHLSVHVAEERARVLALEEINRRLESMNQLRTQIENERGAFVTREWFDKLHDDFRTDVDRRLRVLEGHSSNLSGRFWMLAALLSAEVAVIELFARVWK